MEIRILPTDWEEELSYPLQKIYQFNEDLEACEMSITIENHNELLNAIYNYWYSLTEKRELLENIEKCYVGDLEYAKRKLESITKDIKVWQGNLKAKLKELFEKSKEEYAIYYPTKDLKQIEDLMNFL